MTNKLNDQYREIPAESPPAYDAAMAGPSAHSNGMAKPMPVAPMASTPLIHPATTLGSPHGQGPMVYHYQHPVTGDQIVSLLPPDHPQMVCLQRGHHDVETRFGFLGVLAAIFWFPLGVGLCLLDRRARCRSCGEVLDAGMCG
ncbi:hypothetical protein PENSPDRAFT_753445 [Peniophora sp. CONT]|nr:hypothetical protein PENSPDRAFT_753445 [Peniophora sp. CONT]